MEGARGSQDLEKVYRFNERIDKEFLVFRNCDRIIATTHQQVELITEHYGIPEDHITMIPPGIDVGRYTPVRPPHLMDIRKRLGFAATDVYTVARAATNKGIDLLIQALPTLRSLVPEARIHLAVGANSDRDREKLDTWKALAVELKVAGAIKWLGYIEDLSLIHI